ncbi:MAG TPA: ABC transporter permease [Opitutaceae bacterium]|nr:ABC transporter permease [Opitutaceae bacterium]
MPWYLHLALRQLFPTGRWFPFFTVISALGVALGVALLVIVMGVMGGFAHEIRHMIVDTEGEVQIVARTWITDYPAVVRRIEAVRGVSAATPYARDAVMIKFNDKSAFPMLRGLDLASVERVTQLGRYIRVGSLEDLDDDSIILSAQLAASIGASVGDTVEVYSPLIINKLSADEVFLPRQVRVVGILEIGHQQLDSSTVYGTLRLAQDLYGLGSAVHGIDVRLDAGAGEDEAVARINAALPNDIRALSWQESFSEFLWVLNLERGMIFFLLLFIVIVAAFSVTSSLLISVVRKTREIGLLGALGGRPIHVAACFCAQGLFIGVLGTAAGLALGFTALHFRNDVVLWIARVTQHEEVLTRFYQVNSLPSYTSGSTVALIVVLTIAISTLAGLLPAWKAARLKPVEALRSE